MKENEPESSDSVISRKVEQEVLNILDEKIPDDFYTGLQQANEGRENQINFGSKNSPEPGLAPGGQRIENLFFPIANLLFCQRKRGRSEFQATT